MLSQDVENDIYATAMALADEARRVILPLFRGDALSTENKLADGFDPVTVADRGVEKALFGHAIHLEPRERDRLREVGAAVIHCPTSNTFIGSGLFDTAGLMAQGLSLIHI